MTAGGLTFLSWVRTGLVSALPGPGSLDATLPQAATLPVTLAFADGSTGAYQAHLAGPGDIVGLDPKQVLRCEPPPGATGVQPNYFPFIEFDSPDLPWAFTPGAPAAGTAEDPRCGLRPWLCLVVVPECPLDPPTSQRPLPRITVAGTELPDLNDAWLWAHAQVLTTPGADLDQLLAKHPELTLARLIAPRRLLPGQSYLACVVPAFEAGRRAGLGLELVASAPLGPAWQSGAAAPVELPVYYSWRFATAALAGDFEQLARRLKAARFGDTGVRDLDVGRGGAGLPGPAANEAAWTLKLEGMIVGDLITPGAWPGAWRETLRTALANRLAAGSEELAPPSYGSAYGQDLANTQWRQDLNLDPRYRATAALGTRIVQQNQEALVASAWAQTAALREANRLMRQAQMARSVGQSIDARLQGSAGVGADRLLQMTRPIHRHVPVGTSNVAAALAHNAAVASSLSLPFRRAARPGGPLAKRLTDDRLDAPVLRLALPVNSAAALRPTPELRTVTGSVDFGKIAAPGAGESLATLTQDRVLQPVFPWENNAPVHPDPPKVPYAYLADLVVVTPGAVNIGHALDFDGVPQLGWEQLGDSWIEFASTKRAYVDRPGAQGVLMACNWSEPGRLPGPLAVMWQPGFLFEASGEPVGVPLSGHADQGALEIAALDLGNTGQIDVVVFWQDGQTVVLASGAGWTSTGTRYSLHMAVGRDLDTATGTLRGGWTQAVTLMDDLPHPVPPFSVAGAGNRLFYLSGRTLRTMTLSVQLTGSYDGHLETHLTYSSTDLDLSPYLPEDHRGGAIAAADFGGRTGADLLIYYVAGQDGALRAGYRIAFDLQGTSARWGEMRRAPVPVGGTEVTLYLGATRGSTDQARSRKTSEFRTAAALTQARQERILGRSAPPPAAPALSSAPLVAAVGTAVDPAVTVPATVAARLALATPIPATVSDPLQPLSLTPTYPFPTFELLREAFPDRLFADSARLPDNTVTALVVNRAAIEAFLAGLNHEMGRELLWRGFPLSQGTYFKRFWDGGRDEIQPMETWQGALGAHPAAGVPAAALLLVVRGELLRRMPDVTIYAVPAKPGQTAGTRAPDLEHPIQPLFSGRLDPDLRFFAFALTASQARGTGPTDGHYFVFQEHPSAPRFGLDAAEDGFGTQPATWADVTWPQMAADAASFERLAYIGTPPVAGLSRPDGGSSALTHQWGHSAAHMAHITLQRPVLLARHGSDLIDPGVRP